uniref:DNA ligase n=1 Tax=Acidobacterium capsulatum TaxID=33075 RepID=A0A7V4XUF1_9BACT
MTHPAPQTSAPFDAFARCNDALAATPGKLAKREILAAYLRPLAVPDAARAALYFSGMPFAETDPRRLNTGGSLLGKAVLHRAAASQDALRAAYRRHGDLGAAAHDLLTARAASSALPTLTLAGVEQAFAQIAAARGPAPKLRHVQQLFAAATPVELKYLVKLMLGDLRTGVKQALVEEAIAQLYEVELPTLRRALMLNGSLPEVVVMAAAHTLPQARMRLFHPLGFMLASPVAGVEEAMARFAPNPDAQQAAEHSTPVKIEDKYDGIRAQLHCGDPAQPGRVTLFSRNREDIGLSFPELIEAFAAMPEPVVLDGEILAWQPASATESARAMPFAALTQRLGRKRVTAQMRDQIPVVFMAFDLLARHGELLLDQPLSARRQQLEALVAAAAPLTFPAGSAQSSLFIAKEPADFPRLKLAPAARLESAAQLDRAYQDARARGNEGVMLKDLASPYQPGRRGLAWLKLKRELATLDVVVTGAEFGHGKRAHVLSDYTFAVRDGEELKNIGKAYSGLTDAEIAANTEFLKEHTLEDLGHFRSVEPRLVLEVAFNNIQRSERHNSGFALRFPRILRIRDDKPVDQIDTLARVEELYQSQPDKPIGKE